MFSHRTNWHREHNRLSELLESRRASRKPIYDLTVSNPTECNFSYPQQEILTALSDVNALYYHPHPRGLFSARKAVAEYYSVKGKSVHPENIFLTASTSEACSLILKLLCNAGEGVLVPLPSYPLFEYLAKINDVDLQHYHLTYDHGWQIDIESITRAIKPSTKAIVIVNPHNPTGMFLKNDECKHIQGIARRHDLALIVDEVFLDYPFDDDTARLGTTAGKSNVLTFTLNGISKMMGLPQMKLGWIAVGGPHQQVTEACERFEILCDIFLSVNTPVQVALPTFLIHGKTIQSQILNCTKSNYNYLKNSLLNTPCSLLSAEGGWYAVLQVPNTRSEEELAIGLLSECGIYLFPGYFFDFQNEGYLVVSLLTQPEVFEPAINNLVRHISTR